MICNNCGKEIPTNSSFCPFCNNPVDVNQQVMGQQVVQQPVMQQTNEVKKSGKGKYIIVILLLAIIISLLGYIVVFKDSNTLSSNNTKEEQKEEVSRTIMIYMSPTNLEHSYGIASADLDAVDPDKVDLDKVNVLVYTGGTKSWKNYVKSDENAIYKLTKDGFEKIETYPKKNMNDSSTLESFLKYGYENYKSDKYDLILYDHGGAIYGAIADDFNNNGMISLKGFDQALSGSPFNEKNKLELVIFRTCLNSTIEVANVFDNYAEYLVASEEVTYGSKLTNVFSFLNDIKAKDDAIDVGKKFINSYDKQMEDITYINGYEIDSTYSITDLSKIDNVIDELDKFIDGINLESDYASIARLRNNLLQFASATDDSFDTVDLYSLVKGLSKYSDYDSDKVLNAINDAVVYNWSNINTNGLSIYFPYNGSLVTRQQLIGVYKDIDFSDKYSSFISKFNSKKVSTGNPNSYKSMLVDTSIEEDSGNSDRYNAKVKLSEDQIRDYSKGIAIIFRKDEEGLFQPILSTDNVTLKDDGYLVANIGKSFIYGKGDTEEDDYFLQTIERTISGNRTLRTGAVLTNWNIKDDVKDWISDAATIYFDDDGDNVKVAVVTKDATDGLLGGAVLNLEDYGVVEFISSSYQILDENGNYTNNWINNGIVRGFAYSIDDDPTLKGENILKKVSIDDFDDEFYVVFKVKDVYDNSTYSNLIKIK